jgi:hypothetical protein
MKEESREVLKGTHKGSYNDFKHIRANKNNEINLNIFKLIFNKLKINRYAKKITMFKKWS